MSDKSIELDSEAIELYRQMGGVEIQELEALSLDGNAMAQSLADAERKYHEFLILLAEFTFQVSLCFQRRSGNKPRDTQSRQFDTLRVVLEKLCQVDKKSGSIRIRYRGSDDDLRGNADLDYEVVFGEMTLAAKDALVRARVEEKTGTIAVQQLTEAFKTFRQHAINNLFIRVPRQDKDYKRLWISLQIYYRYIRALQKKSFVTFKMGGKKHSFPVVKNEKNRPDPNLTLLAILNRFSDEKIQALVHKIHARMHRSEASEAKFQYLTVYDAILGLEIFQGKIIVPPIEINNVKWLIMGSQPKDVSPEMAQVARHVMENYDDTGPEASRVLKSVYGDDYDKIDSHQVVERIKVTSGLLDTIDKKSGVGAMKKEVLGNVEDRLGIINDDIYDEITIEENKIKAPGEKTFLTKVHDKLFNLVGFYKKRSITKKKMVSMVHEPIYFDHQDYETLAKDFGVSTENARTLIRLLKSCFDSQGNFDKSTFVGVIPELMIFEKKIFGFLWHNLKETIHHKDRTAFLDGLQLLVDRLEQRQNSVSVLLNDLVHNASVVRFADSKSFMLLNRLIIDFSDRMMSYQITPEDILKDKENINRRVADYAAWKVDRAQEQYFEKMRMIHARLLEQLDADENDSPKISCKELLSLEREAYIFLSLVGGNTARSVMMSALKEYGQPESIIYKLKSSKKHFADLLQLLKIVIRGMALVGEADEMVFLVFVKGQLDHFAGLTGSLHEEDLILQVRESLDDARQKLAIKTQSA